MTTSMMQRFYDERSGEFITIEKLIDWVRAHPLKTGRILPVIIWGGFGIGKTQQIKAYGKARGIEVRTYAPAHDVNGSDIVGKAYRDPETNETTYALPSWLPTEDDPPEGVLFIDELNRAPEEVLAGLMEPLGEGTIAQSGWELPRGWNIIAAANPTEQGYQVHEMDEAMIDRMLHYAPGWDARIWGAWAESIGVNDEIINFAMRQQDQRNNGLITTGEAQLPVEINNALRTTPRTLEYMDALFEPGMPESMLWVCAEGLMGRAGAEGFIEQLAEQEQPLNPDTLLKEPTRAQNGQIVYPYDDALQRWGADQMHGVQLIKATTERMIVHLIRNKPSSEKLAHNRAAQLIGRYLARLSESQREEALRHIAQSAHPWFEVVREATAVWQRELAGEDSLGVKQVAHPADREARQLPAQA